MGPLFVYSGIVIVLVTGMLTLSAVLGQRHAERATGDPYESGIVSTDSAHVRFSAKFYLVAMLFVIFDVEAVFLFAWAIAVPELGWTGYTVVLLFIGILSAALLYEWRIGILDWAPGGRTVHRVSRQKGDVFHAVVVE